MYVRAFTVVGHQGGTNDLEERIFQQCNSIRRLTAMPKKGSIMCSLNAIVLLVLLIGVIITTLTLTRQSQMKQFAQMLIRHF
jgi:hypothetical protein